MLKKARLPEKRRGSAACPEEMAFLDLLRTTDILSRRLIPVLKAADLSATQYNVLRILRGAPAGLACGEIAGRMITRDPDVTRLLDRLEKRGLISRSRETKDRRTVITRITPDGLKLLSRLDGPVRAAHRRQLGHLGRNRLRALTDLLRAARRAVRLIFLDLIFVATNIGVTHQIRMKGSKNRKETSMSTVAAPQTATSTWNIDPVHSVAEFKVKHMMISNVKGQFSGLQGVLTHDETDPTKSHVEISIAAASINTRDAQRDAHLKSADFFDVEKFPALSFRSTQIKRAGEGELAVAGDLTIHGVTKNVVFTVEGPTSPAKDPWGNTRLGASATTKINRKDFGLTWNAALETGGILVGEEVTLTLDVQFIKA